MLDLQEHGMDINIEQNKHHLKATISLLNIKYHKGKCGLKEHD